MIRAASSSRCSAAAVAWPLAVRAQQPAMPVIGFLGATSPDAANADICRISSGLKESGYIEGENVAIEFRWADGQFDRLPALAAELVSRRVALVVSVEGTPVVFSAAAATATIPIVFAVGEDPVRLGSCRKSQPAGLATRPACTFLLRISGQSGSGFCAIWFLPRPNRRALKPEQSQRRNQVKGRSGGSTRHRARKFRSFTRAPKRLSARPSRP